MVVVNRAYDIQAIIPAARRILSIHTVALGDDLIHAARRVPADLLREVIDNAFRGQPASAHVDIPTAGAPTKPREIELKAFPQASESANRNLDRVTILLTDVTVEDASPAESPDEGIEHRALVRQTATDLKRRLDLGAEDTASADLLPAALRALESALEQLESLDASFREVDGARRELLSANLELASVNTSLRDQNEELLMSNEESQAAVEEIQTLSEEQQASNEELETLNEELQATIEELNTSNDDLEARGLELQESASRLEAERSRQVAILASMADAVLVVGPDGQTIAANDALWRMFPEHGEAFQPQDDNGEVLPSYAWPQRRAANGEAFRLEFTWSDPSGERRWYEAVAQPIREAGQGGVVVIRDITDRSLLGLQTVFLALASHELRTPLTAISGSLQFIQRLAGPDADPQRRLHYVELGLEQVHLLDSLIRDLTDVVRLQEGRLRVELTPLDLVPLVQEVVELEQADGEPPPVQLFLQEPELVVRGDRVRLQQVLRNLIGNARKYAAASPSIDVRLSQEAQSAQIEVRDFGPGISAADLPHIFRRFFQVRRDGAPGSRGGLGLGLYISHQLVQAHGGIIGADSEPGQGARFTIRLPLADATSLSAAD
jgi:two-component system CheB/CheR fusion protein